MKNRKIRILSEVPNKVRPITGGELTFSILFGALSARSDVELLFASGDGLGWLEAFRARPDVLLSNFDRKRGYLLLHILMKVFFGAKIVVFLKQVCYDIPRRTARWYHAKLFLLCADNIIANSRYSKEWIMRLIGQRREVRVIPPAAFSPGFDGIEAYRKQSYGLAVGPRIFYAANIRAIKKQKEAVQITAMLNMSGIRLVLAGGVKEPVYMEALRDLVVSNGLEGSVEFKGYLGKDELAAEMSGSDVVLYPADSEGFGIALVEAMALGMPIVAAAGGATTELVKDGVDVLLYTPGDTAEGVEKLRALMMDESLRERLGREAARSAEKYLDWDRYIRDNINTIMDGVKG